MKDAIIVRRHVAGDIGGGNEALLIRPGEEGFLMTSSGDVLTMLPGRHHVPGEGRALVMRRGAICVGVAGAGDAPARSGGMLGGWTRFQCALLSPRRFALRCGEALLGGAMAEDLLTDIVRRALAESLCGGAARPAEVWGRCRRTAGRALLDCGWQLTAFRPERLARVKGVPA